MKNHALAALGSIAHGIRRVLASLLAFVGLREQARFGVPLLVLVLFVAAAVSARDTATILGSRPEVQETDLASVADHETGSGSVWFAFDAVMASSHLATPADLGTFFYLARDPDQPDTGLLVRSGLNDDFIRQRVIVARIIEDESVVGEATEALGSPGPGFIVERTRYLEEVEAGGDPDNAFVPSELGDEELGDEIALTGRILSPADHAACAAEGGCDGEDAAWFYYFADPQGGSTIVLRSPHPPDAIPVRLQGLHLRDSYDLGPVLASDWYAAIDADVPTDRAFQAGQRPPIVVPASWVPTIVFAILGVLLLASQLTGYPVFGDRRRPDAARRLGVGERIDVEITGRMARDQGSIALERSPGTVERLSIGELALRMWRYGLLPRELSRREAEERYRAEEAGERDRLVVNERDQSALVTIERDPAAVEVDAGRLYRIGRSVPAVRVRQGLTDAYLAISDAAQRDLVAAEIRGESEGFGARS